LFFSATMPPEIRRLADKFLSSPKEITVSRPATTAQTIEDFIVPVAHASEKREALRGLLRAEPVKTALIFCNRKRDVDILYRSLSRHGFQAGALHGDLPQDRRTATLERFRLGEIPILVASDVAARGLDIDDITHVVNFDVPYNADDYVHRIGRTGRAGRSGRAFTLATPEDGRSLAAVERLIHRTIKRYVVDTPASKGADTVEPAPEDEAAAPKGRKRRAARGSSRKPKQHEEPQAEAAAAAHRDGKEAAPEPRERPAARQRQAAAKPQPQKPSARSHEDGEAPVGFGDYVPAFLQRRGG
jgi:superfamily II DNA/RNA helicase